MDTVSPLLAKAPPKDVGLVNSMRYLDMKLTLAGDILVKIDRASMAVSLEVRPVYLHRDMLDLAAAIPPSALVDSHESKKLLKSSLRAWLPDSVLYRDKQGFAMPLERWTNGDLGSLFPGRNGHNPVGELLDTEALTAGDAANGHANPTGVRHSLFFLEHWLGKWA